MSWIKKIAAAILVLLGTIGLLICLAGFIGALVVNEPLSNQVVETFGTIDGFINLIDQNAGRIQDGLNSLNEEVRRIQNLEMQTQLSTSQEVITQLLQRVDRLAEGLDQAEANLVEGKAKIVEMQASLGLLEVRILNLIDLASLLLASLFVLLGAGQVLLIRQSWIWFRSIRVSGFVKLPETEGEGLKAPDEDITPGELN